MLKSPLVASVVLALASPLAVAQDKPAAQPATKTQNTQATAERQPAKQPVATATARPAVRDWAAIDTNKDNLISPDEMQKHLQEQWAAQKK